jgi:hypothetical protein
VCCPISSRYARAGGLSVPADYLSKTFASLRNMAGILICQFVNEIRSPCERPARPPSRLRFFVLKGWLQHRFPQCRRVLWLVPAQQNWAANGVAKTMIYFSYTNIFLSYIQASHSFEIMGNNLHFFDLKNLPFFQICETP